LWTDTKYKTCFNERKGTVEQVPEGVDPAFNWNQGRAGRSVSAYENLVQKARDKTPEQFDLTMSSIMKNEVNKTAFYVRSISCGCPKSDHFLFAVGSNTQEPACAGEL
jgi:hypothetical protein